MRTRSAGQLSVTLLVLLLAWSSYCLDLSSEESNRVTTSPKSLPDYNEDQDEQPQARQQQAGGWMHWWSYEGTSGPEYWRLNKRWRLCSEGRKQSPVDIRTSQLVFDHLLQPIELSWLPASADLARLDDEPVPADAADKPAHQRAQKPIRVQLLNSGRGVEIWLEPAPAAALAWPSARSVHSLPEHQDQLILWQGPLSYAYKLYKLELHSTSSPGNLNSQVASEHWIDGRPLDAELQLHFYNRHLSRSAQHALKLLDLGSTMDSPTAPQALPLIDDSRPNLFAVVSVFLVRHEAPNSNRSGVHNPLDFVIDNLGAIQNQGNAVELELDRRRLDALVPERRHYVTYQGSLNRPPCTEGVDWILVNRALKIEASKFEMLFSSQGGGSLNTNQDNARPVMALNRRLLRTTIDNLARTESDLPGSSVSHADPCRLAADTATKEVPKEESTRASNCSGSNGAKQGAQMELSGAIRARQCSMKPNYAYQLRQHYARSSE